MCMCVCGMCIANGCMVAMTGTGTGAGTRHKAQGTIELNNDGVKQCECRPSVGLSWGLLVRCNESSAYLSCPCWSGNAIMIRKRLISEGL